MNVSHFKDSEIKFEIDKHFMDTCQILFISKNVFFLSYKICNAFGCGKTELFNKDVYYYFYYYYYDFAIVSEAFEQGVFYNKFVYMRQHMLYNIILSRNWFAHDFNGCRIKNYTFISMIPMVFTVAARLRLFYDTTKIENINFCVYFIIIM